jgi:site-specific DNA-cytosine methylase
VAREVKFGREHVTVSVSQLPLPKFKASCLFALPFTEKIRRIKAETGFGGKSSWFNPVNKKGWVSDHYYPNINHLQLKRIQALKPNQSMKDLPTELQHSSFQRRANRRVKDGTPTDKRGGAPWGLKRLCFDEPCLTITGGATREFIHPVQNRPLNLRECARIQTFPDDFEFCGNTTQKI